MSTYITHVSAGPYHVVRDEHDGIPLGIFCRQSLAKYLDPDEIFEVTRQGFDFFHAAFGIKYPFGKYDQLFVPEFKEGAMENAGCVTFLEDYVFRSRVTDSARERARRDDPARDGPHVVRRPGHHALVGRPVAERVVRHLGGHRRAGGGHPVAGTRGPRSPRRSKAWAYRQDQLPSTHPIAADIPDIHAVEVNFDGITYAKGASVLKQLVAYVGRDNFLAGVRRYFAAHAWGNATLADLLSALEAISGRDLTAWSQRVAGDGRRQHAAAVVHRRRRRPFHVVLGPPGGAAPRIPTLRSHRDRDRPLLPRPATAWSAPHAASRPTSPAPGTPVPELVGAGAARPGPGQRRRPDLREDPAGRPLADRRWSARIGEFDPSLPAALCWAAAWDMTRDGEMATRDYVRLVLGGAGSVQDISVVQTLLRQAALAVRQYADQAWRPDGLALMASSLRTLLLSAPAGLGPPARLRPLVRRGGDLRRRPGAAVRPAGRRRGA